MKLWNWKKKTEASSKTTDTYEPPMRDFIIKCIPLHKDYTAFEFPVRFVMPVRNLEDFHLQVSEAVDLWFTQGKAAVGTRINKISADVLRHYHVKIETDHGG